MLKIKDNVDLKELEKFGFKKVGDFYVREMVISPNCLNDKVEIIKEPKKIEKIPLPSFDEFKRMSAEERYVITAKEYDLLDELIDKINNLKEE